MGLLRLFRRRAWRRAVRAEARRHGSVLFPGGKHQVLTLGCAIAGLTRGKLSTAAGARLYAAVRFRAYTTRARDPALIAGHIEQCAAGRLTQREAEALWRLVAADLCSRGGRTSPGTRPSGRRAQPA